MKRRNLRKRSRMFLPLSRGRFDYHTALAKKMIDRHGVDWSDLYVLSPMMYHAPIKRSVQKRKRS